MKLLVNILLASCILLAASSCKKSVALENETLIGKWKQTQIYDGYANGGSFQWTYTPYKTSREIEFLPAGKFIEVINHDGFKQECLGTYSVQSGNRLEIVSSCLKTTEQYVISEQSSGSLVLDRHVREGIIREKYIRYKVE